MWEQQGIDLHQIMPDDKQITSTNSFDHVWQ